MWRSTEWGLPFPGHRMEGSPWQLLVAEQGSQAVVMTGYAYLCEHTPT